MIKRFIGRLSVSILLLSSLLMPVTFSSAVFAQTAAEDACAAIEQAGGKCDAPSTTGASDFGDVIRTVVSVLSIIVGIAAVIMIIIGGLRYVLSGGDSSATKGAKDTILYAVIGLVVAIFARAIITFVTSRT